MQTAKKMTNDMTNTITSELDVLKNDASQVMQNLSNLSSHLKDVTKNGMTQLTESALEKINEEMAGYRKKLNVVKKSAQSTMMTVDKKVKSNPYPYLIGSLGIGFALGKLIQPAND